MKSLFTLTILALLTFSVSAQAGIPAGRLAELRADKSFVLKQEALKVQRMLGKAGLLRLASKHDCTDVDVDVDIDVDTSSGGVDANCEARWMDGTCRSWGADQEGTCYPNCEARWMDGTCRSWGADICN